MNESSTNVDIFWMSTAFDVGGFCVSMRVAMTVESTAHSKKINKRDEKYENLLKLFFYSHDINENTDATRDEHNRAV
jgi:hypothetical protein